MTFIRACEMELARAEYLKKDKDKDKCGEITYGRGNEMRMRVTGILGTSKAALWESPLPFQTGPIGVIQMACHRCHPSKSNGGMNIETHWKNITRATYFLPQRGHHRPSVNLKLSFKWRIRFRIVVYFLPQALQQLHSYF